MNKLILLIIAMMITACSSPPPPVPVEWDKGVVTLNGTMPEWTENNVIVPSETVSGQWLRVLKNFRGDQGSYDISVYYATVHSPKIVVHTSDSASFFKAKEWLRKNGAKGVIEYKRISGRKVTPTTNIYFSR